MNNGTKLYGVKILLKYTVKNEKQNIFFEEQVLTVRAESFDAAYEKAEKHVEQFCEEYVNPDGDKVKKEFFKSIDCFLIYPDDGDVQEVYSCFIRNDTELSEDQYIDMLYKHCRPENLNVLRYE